MGRYTDGTTNFNAITTSIQHNVVLGSPDFQLFFDVNHNLYLNNANTTKGQRDLDMQLAKNKTIPELVEDIVFNITMIIMSDELLA